MPLRRNRAHQTRAKPMHAAEEQLIFSGCGCFIIISTTAAMQSAAGQSFHGTKHALERALSQARDSSCTKAMASNRNPLE